MKFNKIAKFIYVCLIKIIQVFCQASPPIYDASHGRIHILQVGTVMTNLHVSRKDTVEMRELGGSMAPIWKKYYKNCKAIIVC